MKFDLTKETFLIYAIKNYDNPHCTGMREFHDDIRTFRYINRLFRRYETEGELKERLIINHIITLCNLFGVESATNMLFFKTPREHWSFLKTFLVYLNYMDLDRVFYEETTELVIPIDMEIADRLRKL